MTCTTWVKCVDMDIVDVDMDMVDMDIVDMDIVDMKFFLSKYFPTIASTESLLSSIYLLS